MSELDRMSDQLQRAYDGEAWHGPNITDVLRDVTAKQAAARPIADVHTIWTLVLHLITWQKAVARRLQGEPFRPDEATNFPPTPTAPSEAEWKAVREALAASHATLQRQLMTLREANLDQAVADGFSSNYVHVHGVIQHNLYHLGQIVLLKKLL